MRKFKKRDRNILLLLLAVIIVMILWGPVMLLARLAIFVIAVYIVYQLLRANI